MNISFTPYLFAIISIFCLTGQAGYSECKAPGAVFTCESTYKLTNAYGGTLHQGQKSSSKIEDIEFEPFNPAECVAASVLFDYSGRFVATYSEKSDSVRVWLETDGVTQVLAEEAVLDVNQSMKLTIKSPLKGIVDTITFSCKLTR